MTISSDLHASVCDIILTKTILNEIYKYYNKRFPSYSNLSDDKWDNIINNIIDREEKPNSRKKKKKNS